MTGLFIYQLGSADARKRVDLRDVARSIKRNIAFAYPEALEIGVCKDFYFFRLPDFSGKSQMCRLQQLGKSIAGDLPALCQEAMRHYFSVAHPPSNQLFKRVVGKKRVQEIMDELAA